ncbi:flagellar hook-length control protein [Mycolicibacterium goodii]|uniref:Flagellar hook-length control protein n=1 Tax=Mycolicibacterium goodii TaxID=134601 RepID=A0ABS6HN69_MYCGD|nr:flagellar hook-length control protein [Mycolicibacterium goodii]MBU8824143.1 flagellar hook-length control protein [Mycolicibacterium goodii]MBU8838074.1 flagellar hook-length control protein [Mycolicibacterium goodii]
MTSAEQIKAAKKAGVDAAMSVAEDIATGKLAVDQLDAAAAAEARALFGRVEGPDDPLWELHVDVARQVLAVGGGIPARELAEWAEVERRAEGGCDEGPARSWIEDALALGADDDEDDDEATVDGVDGDVLPSN